MTTRIELWNEANVPLWNDADTRDKPWMDWHPHPDGGQRSCVLVFPGGGYGMRANHEGDPIAFAAHAAGYHAAVCHYRVQFHDAPKPLNHGPLFDAQRAIRILRNQAEEFEITDGKIACIGFSAGGHLCASTGVHWKCSAPQEDDLGHISPQPTTIAPCYPVFCGTGSAIEKGSFVNLLGKDADKGLIDFFALEKQVDSKTPPMFLWHTADDTIVQLQNSLIAADLAQQHKVPVELHVFPHGAHGLGLAEADPVVRQWWPLYVQWLAQYM